MELRLEKITTKNKKSTSVLKTNDLKKSLHTVDLCFKFKLCKSVKVYNNETDELLLDLH